MVCIRNNATGSQSLVKTFCKIYLGCLWTFTFLMESSFFKKLYIKAFIVITDDLKVFLFRDLHLKACIYGKFDLCGFKTVFSLMGDWNVVRNSEFFMLLQTSSHIFCAKIINEWTIFYPHSTSGFKTEASFNEKISFMRSGKKVFKSLNRRCEIF